MPVEPVELLFARATARHVRETIVAGRTIVRDGTVTGIDQEAVHREVRSRLRAGMAAGEGFRAVLPELETTICRHFSERLGCC